MIMSFDVREQDKHSGQYGNYFESWIALFHQLGALNHPSELHGTLCGRIAVATESDTKQRLAMALEQMGVDLVQIEAAHCQQLVQLLSQTHARLLSQLQQGEMGDALLLLPDDEAALGSRLEALSAWVRGFLEGLATAGGKQLAAASEAVHELMRDFVAISQVDSMQAASEEGERNFYEIEAYVRVGVMTIFTECSGNTAKISAGNGVLH